MSVIYPSVAGNDSESFILNITLLCSASASSNVSTTVWSLLENRSNNTHYLNVIANSTYGCATFTIGEFYNFLSQNKLIFVCVFFVMGIFIAIFGLKLFNVTIFLITATIGIFISGTLFFELVQFNSSGPVLWVVFGTCVFIGCVMGYLAVTYEKVGFFALGFALGAIAGLLLYQGILAPFMQERGPIFLYVFMALLGMIGGGFAMWMWK